MVILDHHFRPQARLVEVTMLDMLKEIILDFQEMEFETSVPRQLQVHPVRGKATICIGVRRCGKSTFLFQVIQNLLNQGVERRNILYLNFFDDRLHALRQEGLGLVLEAYYSLFPEKKNAETVYCFFDEIQMVPGWEPFIDRLLRTEKCEVYITGSSARMLSKDIATQMRGRALAWELFPFSFREFLISKGVDPNADRSSKQRLTVQKCFEQFRESGGFPEVVGLDRPLRIKIHQEYFNAILYRDLVERHDISHPRAASDLAHWLMENAASLYSVNKLTGHLKSLGHRAPKSVVSDFMEWFEDAYFLFSVRLYDASLSRSQANPKKVYCIDHSLVRSVTSGILVNSGHLLENLVFTALRRATENIFYYKSRNGHEVDFVVRLPGGEVRLIQVCESLAAPLTRKREKASLAEAMAALGAESGTIVTLHEEDRMDVDGRRIDVTPAWRFLLDTPGLRAEYGHGR